MPRSFIHHTLGINKDMCSVHETSWVIIGLNPVLLLFCCFQDKTFTITSDLGVEAWMSARKHIPTDAFQSPVSHTKKQIRILRMKLGRHSPNNQLDRAA